MNYKEIIKNILPHAFAVLVFVILSSVYFFPELEGKEMTQHDIVMANGMAKELNDYYEKTGKHAHWTNSMFGGMPAYQIKAGENKNIFLTIQRALRLNLPFFTISIVFAYLIGFYFFFASLRFNKLIAIAGAIAFAFGSYNIIIIMAGHTSKAYSIAYMAPVLAGMIMLYRKEYIAGFITSIIALGIQISTTHYQITYYLMMMMGLYVIIKLVDSIKEKSFKNFGLATGLLIISGIIALGGNATNLLSTNEYGKLSTRGPSELTDTTGDKTSALPKSYILNDYSYGMSESFTLLIPNTMGGASSSALSENSETYKTMQSNQVKEAKQYIKNMPTYWGGQRFTSGPVYIGAIVIFLFVLGLFIVKGSGKWWLALSALFALIMSWGKNAYLLSEFLIDYFPAYNKFRTVSMILVIVSVAVPILAFKALDYIKKNKVDKKELLKSLYYSLGIVGGMTLLMALMGSIFFSFSSSSDKQYLPEWILESLQKDRAGLLRADAFRSLIFILLTGLLLFLWIKEKVKPKLALILITLLIITDVWVIARRYLNSSHFKTKRETAKEVVASDADKYIMQDTSIFRVFDVTSDPFNSANASYFHKSIGGYHGAKLKRYQELIERHIGKYNINVLSMLNAKYFIVPSQDRKQKIPQLNQEAFGNAWISKNYIVVENADQEIAALDSGDLKNNTIVDRRFAEQISKIDTSVLDSSEFINLNKYSPDELYYNYSTSKERLVVFSEIFYDKGWNAYINEKPVPHFRVNYVLRALSVPSGQGTIVFKFEPTTYYMGQKIAMSFSILVILIISAGAGYIIFKKIKSKRVINTNTK